MTDQPQHPTGPDLPCRPDLSKIVIATGNPHKVEELRRLLALPGVKFVGLKDLPDHEALVEPEETGTTFEENATIKAISYAAQTGLPCLADDSGLEVDALGGAPGVISSHYCTDGRETGMSRAERDAANNARLMRELAGVAPEGRSARFVCVMVLAVPNAAPPHPHQEGGLSSPRTTQEGGLSCPQTTQEGGLSCPQTTQERGLSSPRTDNTGERADNTEERADNTGGRADNTGGRAFQPATTTGGRAFQPATATFDGTLQKHTDGDLPHWQVGGATYFVTFRVQHGTLTESERRMVCDACLHWHGRRLILHIATVMPDHVHLVFRPLQQKDSTWPTLSSILQSIKGYTARIINKARGVSGTLWQPEYHDRVLHSSTEIEQKMVYVQENPVRAGLVQKPGEYAFTVRGPRDVAVAGWKARPPEVLDADSKARPPGVLDADSKARPPGVLDADPKARPDGVVLAGQYSRHSAPTLLATSRGTFDGRIGVPGAPATGVPRGTNGFGYDPLFLAGPECLRTGAELTAEEKNRRSHRGVAAKAMLQHLRGLMENESKAEA